MRRRSTLLILIAALTALATACASGPSPDVAAAGRRPATTTTTEAPPEDTTIVKIENGAFQPAIVVIDIEQTPFVEFIHADTQASEPVYVIRETAGLFQSEEMALGDTFRVDFSAFPPDIYRVSAIAGFNRLPGSIDTRPAQ